MQKKPVLVSDVKPLSDIVEHEKTGLVISPNNENLWAKSLESVIQDPVNFSKMGEEGLDMIKKNYSLEIMLQKILQMYKKIQNPSMS